MWFTQSCSTENDSILGRLNSFLGHSPRKRSKGVHLTTKNRSCAAINQAKEVWSRAHVQQVASMGEVGGVDGRKVGYLGKLLYSGEK